MNTELLESKHSVETTLPSSFAPCESEPSIEVVDEDSTTRLANIVLDHRSESTLEEIQGAIAFSSALTRLKNDPDGTKRFFEMLRQGNYLTQAEADAGISQQPESVVSKLRTIEKFSDILFEKKVFRFLRPGIELLYEAAQLIKATGLTGTGAVEMVSAILKSSDGPVRRQWLKKERQKLEPKQPRKKPGTLSDGPQSMISNESSKPISPGDRRDTERKGLKGESEYLHQPENQSEPPPEVSFSEASAEDRVSVAVMHGANDVNETAEASIVAASPEPIVAALIMIKKEDINTLSVASSGAAWQHAADQMASNSVVFVFTTVQTLLSIRHSFDAFRLARCVDVYLLSEPDGIQAKNCDVLAIYEYGDGVDVEGIPEWNLDDTPALIAEQLLLGVPGRRVQFFADKATPGWESLKAS